MSEAFLLLSAGSFLRCERRFSRQDLLSYASVTCLDSHLNSDLNPDSLLDPDLNSDDTQLGEIPICHLNSDLNSGRLCDLGYSRAGCGFWIQIPCDHPSGSRRVFRHMTEALVMDHTFLSFPYFNPKSLQ